MICTLRHGAHTFTIRRSYSIHDYWWWTLFALPVAAQADAWWVAASTIAIAGFWIFCLLWTNHLSVTRHGDAREAISVRSGPTRWSRSRQLSVRITSLPTYRAGYRLTETWADLMERTPCP